MSSLETWEELEEYLGIKYRDVGTKGPAAFQMKKLTGPINVQSGLLLNELRKKITKRKRKSTSLTESDQTEEFSKHSFNSPQNGIASVNANDVVLSSTRIENTPKNASADSVKRPRVSPIVGHVEKRSTKPNVYETSAETSNAANNNEETEHLYSSIEENTNYDEEESGNKYLSEEQATIIETSHPKSQQLQHAMTEAKSFLSKNTKHATTNFTKQRNQACVPKLQPNRNTATNSSSFTLLCQIANRLAQWRQELELNMTQT